MTPCGCIWRSKVLATTTTTGTHARLSLPPSQLVTYQHYILVCVTRRHCYSSGKLLTDCRLLMRLLLIASGWCDWERLLRKEIESPYKPEISDATDISNFDPTFTRKKFREVCLCPHSPTWSQPEPRLHRARADLSQRHFPQASRCQAGSSRRPTPSTCVCSVLARLAESCLVDTRCCLTKRMPATELHLRGRG